MLSTVKIKQLSIIIFCRSLSREEYRGHKVSWKRSPNYGYLIPSTCCVDRYTVVVADDMSIINYYY